MPADPGQPLLPGSTIGILGSGQLGRLLAITARRMGYATVVLSPDCDSPAGQVCDRELVAPYDDGAGLAELADAADVVTVEFENVPARALELLGRHVPVRPGAHALRVTQNRRREKEFLAAEGLPHAPFGVAVDRSTLVAALAKVGEPALVKSAGFGYDGKGQVRVLGPREVPAAEDLLASAGEVVVEGFVEFRRELSVLVARGADGHAVVWGPIENRHRGGVLDLSLAPAGCGRSTAEEARGLARRVATRLEFVGLMAVEFFETPQGNLLVNEIAPRPHNSGHLTLEAAGCDQFELQLRAIAGLPLAETPQLRPAAMANLLGDLWEGGEPDWRAALNVPGVRLHLYGKREARRGRKMGHLTAVAATLEESERAVATAREALLKGRSRRPGLD